MNRQIENVFKSLFLGLAFASGYFAENLPSYAIPNPKPEEVKQLSPTRQIEQVQLIGNTVLTPEDLTPILQPIQGKAIAPEQADCP